MPAKKISHQSQIGQQGVNLVEHIVLQMGHVWRATSNADAGIDGTIELRDSTTGEVKNSVIQVQIKATTVPFQAETEGTFEYTCEANDLDYWLQGNAPVILIVCRPGTNEAYWLSMKDYFDDLSRRKSRKARFHKQNDRFDAACASALANLALPRDVGVYFTPLPRREQLYTNLLRVSSVAERLYLAQTDYRTPRELWAKFKALGVRPGSEWILKSKQLISVHDLSQYPWTEICDGRNREEFESAEWADSIDPDRRREFAWLLKQCLREKAHILDLRYDTAQATFTSRRRLSASHSRSVIEAFKARSNGQCSKHIRARRIPAESLIIVIQRFMAIL